MVRVLCVVSLSGVCEGSAQHIARILHTATADPHATALAVHDSSGRGGSPASYDGTVRVWRAAGDAHPVILRSHEGWVWGVAFSRDGRVASADGDGTVQVWQTADDADPVVLRGHTGLVFDVAFSPDGQRLASGGFDGTVRMWRAAGDADPVVLRGYTGAVWDVAFSPDGQRVASDGEGGTMRVWTCEVCGPIGEVLALAKTRVTRELTCEERRTFLHEACRL